MSAWKITGIMIFKNTPDQICSRCRPNWDEGLLRYICDGKNSLMTYLVILVENLPKFRLPEYFKQLCCGHDILQCQHYLKPSENHQSTKSHTAVYVPTTKTVKLRHYAFILLLCRFCCIFTFPIFFVFLVGDSPWMLLVWTRLFSWRSTCSFPQYSWATCHWGVQGAICCFFFSV